jgi:hypothetical protein
MSSWIITAIFFLLLQDGGYFIANLLKEEPVPTGKPTYDRVIPQNKESCEKTRGLVWCDKQQRCDFGFLPDEGKECRDSNECIGFCMPTGSTSQKEREDYKILSNCRWIPPCGEHRDILLRHFTEKGEAVGECSDFDFYSGRITTIKNGHLTNEESFPIVDPVDILPKKPCLD